MIFSAILHILSLVSLFYAFLAIFAAPFPSLQVMLTVVCTCAACGVSAEKTDVRRMAISLLIALLPLALIRQTGQILYVLPPVGYTIYLLLSERVNAAPWAFRTHALIAMAPEALFFMMASEGGHAPFAMGFALTAFLSSVAFLRLSRLGRGTDLRYRSLDLLSTLAVPGAAMAVIFAILLFSGQLAKVFPWLLSPFAGIIYLLVSLANKFPVFAPSEPIETTEAATEFEDAMEVDYATSPDSGSMFPDVPPVIWRIIWFLLACAVFYVVVKTLVKLLKRNPRIVEVHAEQGSVSEFVPDPVSDALRESNRKKVRKIYTKYIHLLEPFGFRLHIHDTSQDVYECTMDYTGDDSDRILREIYVKARYRLDQPVTDADVKEAKRQYALLKDQLKRKKEKYALR